jgi:hypothetical protein
MNTLSEGKVCRTPVGGADMPPTFFRFAGLDLLAIRFRTDGGNQGPITLPVRPESAE